MGNSTGERTHIIARPCIPFADTGAARQEILPHCLSPNVFSVSSMAQSLLKLAGFDWEVPDFSSMRRRQKHLAVTITANPTTTGLHLLVDSTEIKLLGEGNWKTQKHGANYRPQWRQVHLEIDATTL